MSPCRQISTTSSNKAKLSSERVDFFTCLKNNLFFDQFLVWEKLFFSQKAILNIPLIFKSIVETLVLNMWDSGWGEKWS